MHQIRSLRFKNLPIFCVSRVWLCRHQCMNSGSFVSGWTDLFCLISFFFFPQPRYLPPSFCVYVYWTPFYFCFFVIYFDNRVDCWSYEISPGPLLSSIMLSENGHLSLISTVSFILTETLMRLIGLFGYGERAPMCISSVFLCVRVFVCQCTFKNDSIEIAVRFEIVMSRTNSSLIYGWATALAIYYFILFNFHTLTIFMLKIIEPTTHIQIAVEKWTRINK